MASSNAATVKEYLVVGKVISTLTPDQYARIYLDSRRGRKEGTADVLPYLLHGLSTV